MSTTVTAPAPEPIDLISDTSILDNAQLSEIPLPGQIAGIPGGGGVDDPFNYDGLFSSDGTGTAHAVVNPTINPNPSGDWMGLAKDISTLASGAFKAFGAGSPSVAVPRPRQPHSGITMPSVSAQGLGGVSWGVVAAVGIGTLVVIALVKYA